MTSAIGSGTYGLTTSTSESAQKTNYAYNQLVPCLYSLDTTITANSLSGSAITYAYNLNYNYRCIVKWNSTKFSLQFYIKRQFRSNKNVGKF